jgi:alpha-L-rhamnosidase
MGARILGLATTLLVGSLGAPNLRAEDPATPADPLLSAFADPPNSARPRVWWHWMNGNVTKDGIREDMQWMRRVGIGGLQNFDANLMTPQVVEKRLAFMTPEWQDAFRYAATLADKLNLELAIASSPGWSETGGPWVQPKDGLKKVVWSDTRIVGGRHYSGKLAIPPTVTGPYQFLPLNDPLAMLSTDPKAPVPTYYADTVVLAYPATNPEAMPAPQVTTGTGEPVDASKLRDNEPNTVIEVTRGTADDPAALIFTYPAAEIIQSATMYLPGVSVFSGPGIAPRLEASDDGKLWRHVADLPPAPVPVTVSFTAVKARQFRVLLPPAPASPFRLGDPAPGVAGGEAMSAFGASTGAIKIAELTLSPEARVDRFEAKAGFSIERDYYALSPGKEDFKGIASERVIDLSDHMKPDGTLDWNAPKGQWHILRMGYSLLGTTNHPATREATGLEVDKFDGAAVGSYLQTYLGMYTQAVGPTLIGEHGVRAMLSDSIEVGAANWTPKFIEQFKRLRGYDPTPWLPALTGVIIGSRSASDGFLYDYRHTLADLIASEHYGTVAAVAHEHGLKVYGEALEDGRPSLGDDMTMRSHTDVPMSAMWTYPRQQGPKPTYLADIKGAASVAHIYGQNLVAAESMTSAMAPWAYAPRDLRRVIDLEFATGVNRPVIHTSVHQPVDDKIPGLSLFIFGQYFNRHDTWAEMARPWVDYMARNSYMLQQGRNVADVAYFYGEEAPLTGLYAETPVADAPTHYAYDFVSVDALMNHLQADGGGLVADGGARYRVLFLGGSSRRMTLSTLQRIASLVEYGATVIGDPPASSPSLNDNQATFDALVHRLWSASPVTKVGRGSVIAGKDIESALLGLGLSPDFSYPRTPPGTILFVHRQLADGDLYFVDNREDRAEDIVARFRVSGKIPELWHADTGITEAVSYRIESDHTLVPLHLAPDESTFVVFRKPAAGSATIGKPILATLQALTGPWTVSFQPNRGAPEQIVMPNLGSLSDQPDPGVKYFSGIATYMQEFVVPAGHKPAQGLALDLGQVCDLAEVSLNGTSLGTAWHAPYLLDVGSALKPGRNRLEIRVADLWVNRLIGDAQPGAKKITWTSMPSYRADAPLRCSGLVGPIRLQQWSGSNGISAKN